MKKDTRVLIAKPINGIRVELHDVAGIPRARFFKGRDLLFDVLVDSETSKSPTIIIRGVEGAKGHSASLIVQPEVSNVVKIRQRRHRE